MCLKHFYDNDVSASSASSEICCALSQAQLSAVRMTALNELAVELCDTFRITRDSRGNTTP
eukprot:scaffold45575_cov19-Prasinocladus_malaysianus.AAC.1